MKNKTNKQKPKRKEPNIRPVIVEMTILCLEDGWSRAAEDKSGNTRAVNDFHCHCCFILPKCCVGDKIHPQHQFCSAGRRVDMVSGRRSKMSQVLVVEKTEVMREREREKNNSTQLSNSEVPLLLLRTGSRSLPRPLVLFEELCTRSLCKLSTQHFP